MLEKEVVRSIENINETKKSMIQMNQDVLKMHTDANEKRLAIIEAQLCNDMEEEARLKLVDEKNQLLKELAELQEEIEKDNAEIEEIGKDLELKGAKYDNAYDLLEELERRSSIEEYSPESIDKVCRVKSFVMDSLDLNRLDASRIRFAKNYLKSNYKDLSRNLQTKLAKDKKFIYPSCFQLKSAIRDMLKIEKPEMEDKELDKLAKIYTSYLILHLDSINLKKEGIYVYYLMQNIYKLEFMKIDQQFEYRSKLISILDSKVK